MRKFVFGATLATLVVMACVLVWALPGERPYRVLTSESDPGTNAKAMEGVLQPVGDQEAAGRSAALRRPVDPEAVTPGPTSLLLRVIEVGTGRPVPGYAAALSTCQ